MPGSGCSNTSRSAHTARLALGIALAGALFFAAVPAALVQALTPNEWNPIAGQSGGAGYLIELGDALVYPDIDEAIVPVFLSSETDVESWQMGLDYEDLLYTLTLSEIRLSGTASAGYGGEATLTAPDDATGGFWRVRVDYPSAPVPPSGPLPEGSHIHVADLVFSVDRDTLDPGSTEFALSIVGDQGWGILINDTIAPNADGGVLTLYAGDLVAVADGSGDNFSHAFLPVLLWNDAPVTDFSMGLDYEDILLCGVDVSGGPLAALAPEDYEITILPTATGSLILLSLFEGTIPAGDEVQIFSLEFETALPVSGDFPVTPALGQVFLGTEEITNLAAGNASIAANFIRGDVNFDAKVTLVDASLTLMYLYMDDGDLAMPCVAAGNANGDDSLDVVDPIYLLTFLYNAGPTPPPPYPDPGTDDSGLPCLGD
ncbi:MAG: hypothetical protein L0Z55_02345 [Planctomycetes bacterium]|nr:hypothetical protein [Planctomycetota bacterium]